MEKRFERTMLATACLPLDEHERVDFDLLGGEVQRLRGAGVEHIYLFGTAGEGYDITEDEFDEIVGAFADMMRGAYPMVCVIASSFRQMLSRIERAGACGVRDFQLTLPCWGALADDELSPFFHALCDPFPESRFLLYNISRAGRVLSCGMLNALAKEIPNLCGAKFPTRDIGVLREMAEESELRYFLTEAGFAYACAFGAEVSYLLSIGASDLNRARAYYEAGAQGDFTRLFALERDMARAVGLVIDAVGSAIDGGYDKVIAKLASPRFPLRLRTPYRSIDDEAFAALQDRFKAALPDWGAHDTEA